MASINTSQISELKYTVFMSYSRDDDDYHNGFVTYFNNELNRVLIAGLKKLNPGPTHFDKKNGTINGPLNEALKIAIGESFAMMLFVHDEYIASEWCLQELKHFKEIFEKKGFEKRFFIVAMSKNAITQLEETPAWKETVPRRDLIWLPFFKKDDPNSPLDIFIKYSRGTEAVVASEFWEPFSKIRDAIVKEFKTASRMELASFRPNKSIANLNSTNSIDSLIYIESERGQEKYWEPLGKQVAAMWDTVVALEQMEPKLLLRPTALPMHNLQDRPRLDNADGVILIWEQKTPESLIAQIGAVEPKLQGPRTAPGLIAYLIEVGQTPPETVPETLMNWPVVRFATRKQDGGSATVLQEDMPKLAKYLRDVMAIKRSAR